jgi:hypothetical protein
LRLVSFPDRVNNVVGGFQPQIRCDEHGFQLFNRFGIEPGRASDDALEFVSKSGVSFLQPALEFVEKAHG